MSCRDWVWRVKVQGRGKIALTLNIYIYNINWMGDWWWLDILSLSSCALHHSLITADVTVTKCVWVTYKASHVQDTVLDWVGAVDGEAKSELLLLARLWLILLGNGLVGGAFGSGLLCLSFLLLLLIHIILNDVFYCYYMGQFIY